VCSVVANGCVLDLGISSFVFLMLWALGNGVVMLIMCVNNFASL
jgi:hypothetical protein